MDQATLLRGKPGRIMLAGAAFLLLVAMPYLFAHFRQGQRAANRGESTVKVERPKDWSGLQKAFTEKRNIAGTVAEQVKGGFRVDVGVRAFNRCRSDWMITSRCFKAAL